MDYQEEIRAKLAAVHALEESSVAPVVDLDSHEEKLLNGLSQEFEFGQYDLEESDVLRSLKILDIVASYSTVFKEKNALKVFYVLCRIDAIKAKRLHQFCALPTQEFKDIINAMAKAKLVVKNDYGELELTMDAQSLASRIGVEIY
jgi:hypothetical protein